MKNNIMEKASGLLAKTKFTAEKHSPEILAVIGTVGVVATVITASKATLKVHDVLDESKDTIEKIHYVNEHPDAVSEQYTEDDMKKDLTTVYVQTGLKVVKLYAPAVVLGGLSLGCLLASNDILRKRNAALTAAYAAVDRSFKEYKGRVAERFGEAVEKEIRYGIRAEQIDVHETDENGNVKTETKEVYTMIDDETGSPIYYSPYAKCFDEGDICWKPDAEYNLMFLRQQQHAANQRLKKQKFLTLNEVYEMLGFPKTKAGMIIGWVYNLDNPELANFVDFNIYDIRKPGARDFINGRESAIWLDFNVDGDIYALMK